MGVNISKYIDLQSRYEKYGEDGYFIEPHIIEMMLFDELELSNVEEFINGANITITEEEIKKFLNKKFEEENPELKKRIETPSKTSGRINLGEASSIEKIKSSAERFNDEIKGARYHFEPYSLQYFKIYTSILKKKCTTLLSVLNDINRCKSEQLSEESNQRLSELDFHINAEGNIYMKDAERLADAIIYNVKDLNEKLQIGNNLETYLTFKESKHRLMKDGIWEKDIYPSKEIQRRDGYYISPEFIALSEAQEEQRFRESINDFCAWLYDIDDDEYTDDKNPQLAKEKKNSKK